MNDTLLFGIAEIVEMKMNFHVECTYITLYNDIIIIVVGLCILNGKIKSMSVDMCIYECSTQLCSIIMWMMKTLFVGNDLGNRIIFYFIF